MKHWLIAWILVGVVQTGLAREEILSYHSDIVVHSNSTMTVTETIKVRAEGNQIKRGIYRDFPTKYKGRNGRRYVVGFSVKKVLRDGKKDGYHFEDIRNGQRVYIGKKKVMLKRGQEYTYALTYKTDRQLGYFENHDELYWNVTGTGWAFPINKASATVSLPGGIAQADVKIEGYTGKQGSKGQDYETSFTETGKPHIEVTRELNAKEGLTLVVTWPKGFVREPTTWEKITAMFTENRNTLMAMTGCSALLLYYMIAWVMFGIDPAKGTIVPRFYPPHNVSPAAARFIARMGYDNTCFAAALISLGVKGFLKIEENHEKAREFTLRKEKGATGDLSKGENSVFGKLLGSRSSIVLKQKNHSTIRAALEGLKKALKKEHKAQNFKTNGKLLIPGVLTIIATGVFIGLKSGKEEVGFLMLWLSFWTIGVIFLAKQVYTSWRGISKATLGPTIFITLFALPFFAAEIGVGIFLGLRISFPAVLILVGMILLTIWFYDLLKQPTHAGRKLMDELEGFKMYLSVAERESFEAMKGPERTPELFEAYLPYAFALGVEQEWSEMFAGVLQAAGQYSDSRGYHSRWYHGHSMHSLGAGAFAGALGGALATAVASSSTSPGSSSGSGGGGSSGGGGGGGGGGGW